ncbi:hypothetical protein [Paenibacillus popilliae]|uniref:Uncharacterized protein conserved in bacteria n=1 Tax=Paenibacillus popilliae ATCC 14706 TaxID=1212764 RepID=M9LIM9_PAEPP|nr:hypothetical protein [Paenibacillus popilliae]GAC43005.1 uncharacterized protein conserved in bacteria [Paenibacillus popilliae ATCC 14706]
MENIIKEITIKGGRKVAVNDWVELVYSEHEEYVGQTVKVVDIRGTNVRVNTDDGNVFWTDVDNLSLC